MTQTKSPSPTFEEVSADQLATAAGGQLPADQASSLRRPHSPIVRARLPPAARAQARLLHLLHRLPWS